MVKGFFVRRLNRFVVECRLESGEIILSHLPNPGRLWELLYPDMEMLLADGKKGKYAYGVLGVRKGEKWVYLHTLGNNDLAERLLKCKSVAGLEDYSIVRREVSPEGSSSRFDFLLERDGEPLWLEVKMCSLFQGKSAMFPDAPTLRGQKHLDELAELHNRGYRCAVLFIVQDEEADYFLPEYHTDPEFARRMYEYKDLIEFFAVGTSIDSGLNWSPSVKQLEIPLEKLAAVNHDSGLYLILLELEKEQVISVGALGEQLFPKGWYVYVGSAKTNLNKRVERHLRKRKKYHWHIDYLRQKARTVKAIPIRTPRPDECTLAQGVGALSNDRVPGFGCSDCDCDSHLFRFEENPLDIRAFVEYLLYWRMERDLYTSP